MAKLKTCAELSDQKTYSRNDLLVIFDKLEKKLELTSNSRLFDIKEALGFKRYQEPIEEES